MIQGRGERGPEQGGELGGRNDFFRFVIGGICVVDEVIMGLLPKISQIGSSLGY